MSRAAAAPAAAPFIEAYIAPDMHMRPLGETIGLLEEGGSRGARRARAARALRAHRRGLARHLEERWDEFVALVGEEVARVWRLYLVGGALAFEDGRMGVDQILAVRPDRGESDLGRRPLGWS